MGAEEEPGAKRAFSPNAIHLIRTAQQLTLQLSQMADQKASILMGATFVVFTISVGQARSGTFSIPLMLLAFFSFVSAMLAVFAVLPSVSGKPKGKANILFFGVFTQLDEDEFADRVIDALDDDERIYRLMLRDIHQNGQVLQAKKYRYLGLAYRTFLVGLTVTFLSFILVVYLGWKPI
ncbi:Pycsar system effector family protein [Sphingomonas colocasiae]|uniref:DUF5706 domain-containing protein n=1 Tax=Sphingomonas colocasiae TaxID=1848973 RepID=A0ABS7Q036_9SPHN|nr:Pycsar system effector family protein [Sphingomonas colocasiae]MBY8825932.1 DUF5706 domain-containing protein [Sphingomonas colocasiae]